MRGIFNKKNGKLIQSYQLNNDHSKNLSDNSADFVDNAKLVSNNKLRNHLILVNQTI